MRVFRAVVVCLVPLFAGCDAFRTQGATQLERVAKDWCLSIRASQVLPVYPLTEDVQPGDVFLVQTPVEDQVKVYRDKGYLPLDNQVCRLYPASYFEYYRGRYGIDDSQAMPPGIWQFPTTGGGTVSYAKAPRAAFPSYGFSVSRSEGLNVAVPVHAVPVGLNLLDSASASGVIALKDAYTFGVDEFELQQEATRWAAAHPEFIRQFRQVATTKDRKGEQFYLRVVSRVYMVQTVDVSLFANQGFGGDVSAGVNRPVDLLDISKANAPAIFENVNKILGQAPPTTTAPSTGVAGAAATAATAGTAAPPPAIGGRLKVVMAANRSVSLTETFDRPLVIGYLAFDLPIDSGGNLQPPVSTRAQLDQRPLLPATQTDFGKTVEFGPDANTGKINQWLNQNPKNRVALGQMLTSQGLSPHDIPDVLFGKPHAALRAEIISAFDIK